MFAQEIPQAVCDVIDLLEAAGFETWLVGGFVRDLLLGRALNDFDLATAAPWQTTKKLCLEAGYAVHETGTEHGTLTVVAHDHVLEITTFRTEGLYRDHRHPSEVAFTDSIEEDLGRRDFTMNAMAYHPERGILDPYHGETDLQAGLIRCVGDSQKRFAEDALRILRGLRFAAQLGFALEEATAAAAFEKRDDLNFIAGERIEDELTKLLCGESGEAVYAVLMDYTPILNVVLPELIPMEGLDQKTKYHIYDVYEHTAHVVCYSLATPLSRWAALLHDTGKPDTFTIDETGTGHMYGHQKASEKYVRAIAKRLHFSRAFTHDLSLLVLYHDARPAPTRKSVRKLYAKLENKEYLFRAICDLMRADALAQSPLGQARVAITDEVEAIFDEMLAEEAVFSLRDLPISGKDLIAAGIPEGPAIGDALNAAFQEVIEERLPLDRDALLAFALDQCPTRSLSNQNTDRPHLLLDRLLAAHAQNFDVEREREFAGRTFDGYARFHSEGERYVLTRRAKLWGVNVFEHILFLCVDHLDQTTLSDLVTFMRTDALAEVELIPDHMTTYLSLVLIANSADEEVLRAIRKTSFRKNFSFGLKGWADLRLCAVNLSTGIVATNAMGKDLGKTVEANLLAE